MDDELLDAWNTLYQAVRANDLDEVDALIHQLREMNIPDDTIRAIINRNVTLQDFTNDEDIKQLLREAGGNPIIQEPIIQEPIIQEAGSKKRGRRATKRHAKKRRATKRRTA